MQPRGDSTHPLNIAPARVTMRCPSCRREAVLDDLSNTDFRVEERDERGTFVEASLVGIRRCPNEACHLVVFVVLEPDVPFSLQQSYPTEVLDFDASDLPAEVLATFEEAIKCHAAGCYRASAAMTRRTLEVACDDRGANGSNLKNRIDAMAGEVPAALVAALHDLRFLGNDALHVDLKHFDDVGQAEAEAAILVVKEVLKSLYQMEAIGRALAALKKAP